MKTLINNIIKYKNIKNYRLSGLTIIIQELQNKFNKQNIENNNIERPKIETSLHQLISEQSNNKLNIPKFARHHNISHEHLIRIFKKKYNITPNNLLIENRINRAITYLKATNISISEIAEICGFKSSNYFHKIFKKRTGKTPNKFRN